jgi:hypothetical protein
MYLGWETKGMHAEIYKPLGRIPTGRPGNRHVWRIASRGVLEKKLYFPRAAVGRNR